MNEHNNTLFKDIDLDDIVLIQTTVGKFYPIKGSIEFLTDVDLVYAISFIDMNQRELITRLDLYSIILIATERKLVAGE